MAFAEMIKNITKIGDNREECLAAPTMMTLTRLIQLTEITATSIPPEQAQYRYKCEVTVRSQGKTRLRKTLLTRLQPNWLVDVQHPGDCDLAIALFMRAGDAHQPWQVIGQVELATAAMLGQERSKEFEFPLQSWAEAPNLTLKTRLTQTALENSETDAFTLLNLSDRLGAAPSRPPLTSTEETPVELPEAIPLTLPEAVIVKDVWNKLRAWKELQIELFFKRWLLEVPELEYLLGETIDQVPDFLYEMLDCCVRQLCPYTENVVGEPLMGIPPDRHNEFNTVEEYGALFADIGLGPKHWLKARQVWMWMLPMIPYLEDYDREDLAKGEASALYKFFNTHVIGAMVEAIETYQAALSPEILQRMASSWDYFGAHKKEMGMEFYQALFAKYPEVLPIFGRADMDYLSSHLFQSLEFLFTCLAGGDSQAMLNSLRHLGRLHGNAGVPSSAYAAIADIMFLLFEKYVPDFDAELRQAWQTLIDRVCNVIMLPKLNEERLLKKAAQFLEVIATEQAWEASDRQHRWQAIQAEVEATGTYTHTYEELAYGAKLAWRNASKCIGRIQWNNMVVRDCRHISHPDEMFRELEEHLRIATNGGNIQITMTVFRPKQPKERWGPRIWNPQLVRYAAYEQPNGSVLGDRANLGVTKAIMNLGWQPPSPRGDYDILPLVIEVPGMKPQLYELQREDILEVELEHPMIPGFKDLNLRWYAVPAIANFRMDIGGVTYACLPFNGWYMGTEIARDFLEDWRYDKLEAIAAVLGLDTTSEQTLWRDRVALELNLAVLHSFQKAKVTMVDHQSAAQQFLTHDLREKKAGRECPGDYGWVVPPAGGSACPVWHHQMRDFYLDPAYHHAADRWAVEDGMDLEAVITTANLEDDRRDRIVILYGSETGTAEGFARRAARQLARYRPHVLALDEYDRQTLAQEQLLLVITSTFGNGEVPANGQQFYHWLQQQPVGSLAGLNYAVLGIGSTVYPAFCAAGIALDKALRKAGGNGIVPLHKADEIKGQAQTFQIWLDLVGRVLGEDATRAHAALQAPQLRVQWLNAAPPVPTSQGIAVPVVANQELLKTVVSGSRSTRAIAFDLSQTDLQYATGDHVAVYPQNPDAWVQALGDRLALACDRTFTAAYVGPDGAELEIPAPITGPTTVGQLLREVWDLTLREPLDALLRYLHQTAQSEVDQHRLGTWLEILAQGSAHPDAIALTKSITDNFLTLVDLFSEFPSCQLDLAPLLELVPPQKPRLYSISSCPQLYPSQLQLTVGVLQVTTDAGKVRPGLCSNYLAALEPGTIAQIGIRRSDFRPPADPQAPVLMVGPGTGVSPLLAFLQQRQFLQQQGTALGQSCLYFGCRNADDFLYEDQLKTWLAQGVLTELQVAMSRLGDRKTYVQDLMQQNAAQVWQFLSQPDCHYYVCGDAKMADDVFAVFLQIARSQGGLDYTDAVAFFEQMKQEHRFFTDVWGVTLNYQEAIGQVQKDNYAQAERWLQRVQQTV
ncbi:MAG: nitric oxide synthase oxygenase [Spirulinaceae cyanobacterium]